MYCWERFRHYQSVGFQHTCTYFIVNNWLGHTSSLGYSSFSCLPSNNHNRNHQSLNEHSFSKSHVGLSIGSLLHLCTQISFLVTSVYLRYSEGSIYHQSLFSKYAFIIKHKSLYWIKSIFWWMEKCKLKQWSPSFNFMYCKLSEVYKSCVQIIWFVFFGYPVLYLPHGSNIAWPIYENREPIKYSVPTVDMNCL